MVKIRAELRKAGVGFLWLLGAILVIALVLVTNAPRQVLTVTALALLVPLMIMLWHLIWAMRMWVFDMGEHETPRQQNIKLALAGTMTFSVSAWLIISASRGLDEGVAPAFRRNGEDILLATSPGLFWLAISLRLGAGLGMIGLLLWGLGRSVLRRRRNGQDATAGPQPKA